MEKNLKKLVLLHSNDMHGDFLAEQIDDNLVGGVSMLSGYVNKIREEEPNSLYCIAGDMFRGSVIDSEFKGFSTIELMNMLAPDVVTIGNHETDYGVAHLLFIEKCAKFPIINANMRIRTNNARLFRPYYIKMVDGMKILFIGILTEQVLSQTRNDGIIGTFVDISDAAEEVGRICNAHNGIDIDLTVLLTHIGFEEDKKLAAALDPSWGVDVIIGGHSHTFIEEPAKVNDILIVQAGTGTDQIGRFDIMIDTDRNCVDSYEWQAVPIDASHCPVDTEMEKILTTMKAKTDVKYKRVVTHFTRKLTHPCRTQETELGDLMADVLKIGLGVDVMLVGSGSIRDESMGPVVLFSNLVECYPYDGPIFMIKVTGATFKHMIKYMVRDEVWEGKHTEFYQVSDGVEVEYDRAAHSFLKFNFQGEPLDDERVLSIGLAKYHFLNCKESFDVTRDELSAIEKPRVICTSDQQMLDEYMTDCDVMSSEVYGRLVIH